jgi:hypothetical protein
MSCGDMSTPGGTTNAWELIRAPRLQLNLKKQEPPRCEQNAPLGTESVRIAFP